MLFMDKFPYGTFQIGDQTIFVRDFIRSVAMKFSINDEENLFQMYEMMDGEKIENVSYKLYGSTEYHWVLLFINNFVTLQPGPKTDTTIRKMCADVYGDLDAIHHYENVDGSGEWVDEFFSPSVPVTNYEQMWKDNESSRSIKILRPEYLTEFVSEYMKQIK